MKILITGSEGFVGQHAVSLLKQTHQLIGISRQEKLENATNVEYVNLDILNIDELIGILTKHKPDAILHLAGIAKTWNNDPFEVYKINLFGTINIYQAILSIQKTSEYNPKIIFIGSGESYGLTSDPNNITEEMLLGPINEYGASKASADRASFQYAKSHGLNITILRPFPHIGPGQKPGFFVPDMASQIVELEKSPDKSDILVGNLQTTRDFCDVRDVVQAYKLALETNLPSGEVYNISSGVGVRVADVLNELLALSTKKVSIKQDQSKIRPVDLPVFVGNNSKFTNATGWKKTYDLKQSLQDVLDYWRRL